MAKGIGDEPRYVATERVDSSRTVVPPLDEAGEAWLAAHAGQPKSDGGLLREMGTDGAKWAQAFFERNEAGIPALDPTPGGFLHVWFVNALEAGRAAGAAQEARTHDVERGLKAAGVL